MLTIETDAGDSTFELAGLPFSRLSVQLGAGKTVLRFSQPDPWALRVFDLDAGAGSVEIDSLANADGANLTLEGAPCSATCGQPSSGPLAPLPRLHAQRCRCSRC
jgi:hypothetical protein